MEPAHAQEILACLPDGRTPFRYYKDRYALLLLSMVIGGGRAKRDLENTVFNRLLGKPAVRDVLATSGDGVLRPLALEAAWPHRFETYLMTVGTWNAQDRFWGQASRPGVNLVLQLNFSTKHNERFRELLQSDDLRWFQSWGHPIAAEPFCTMAWARLDIDLGTGVALIEEIQNDWIRYALAARRRTAHQEHQSGDENLREHARRLRRYVDSELRRHEALWDEAMLAATLVFLRRELGVRTVFYHTPESGKTLKRIKGRAPPRSLYTVLPRRFCFAPCARGPAFLARKAKSHAERRRRAAARFQVLEL